MIERDKENATNASPCNLTAYSVAEYILLQYEFRYHFTVMTSGTSAKKTFITWITSNPGYLFLKLSALAGTLGKTF